MRRSTDRIIVSHAGTLPRTDDLRAMMQDPSRAEEFTKALPAAVKEVVRKQVEVGIDVVNDGELGKRDGFSSYPRSRISGIEVREFAPGEGPARTTCRDATASASRSSASWASRRARWRAHGRQPGSARGTGRRHRRRGRRTPRDGVLHRPGQLHRQGALRGGHPQPQGRDRRGSTSKPTCRPLRRARWSTGCATSTTRRTRRCSSRSPRR